MSIAVRDEKTASDAIAWLWTVMSSQNGQEWLGYVPSQCCFVRLGKTLAPILVSEGERGVKKILTR